MDPQEDSPTRLPGTCARYRRRENHLASLQMLISLLSSCRPGYFHIPVSTNASWRVARCAAVSVSQCSSASGFRAHYLTTPTIISGLESRARPIPRPRQPQVSVAVSQSQELSASSSSSHGCDGSRHMVGARHRTLREPFAIAVAVRYSCMVTWPQIQPSALNVTALLSCRSLAKSRSSRRSSFCRRARTSCGK
jgi:hypothetical protein